MAARIERSSMTIIGLRPIQAGTSSAPTGLHSIAKSYKTIDALDEAMLALVSAHYKLRRFGKTADESGTASGESFEIDESLAKMEASEAFAEYQRKRWEFQVNLQYLRQTKKVLLDEPIGDEQADRAEIEEEYRKKLKKGV